ncbi:MAG: chromosomal replication initiator protein DnaA [Christensenellaceae bacterium]|nr:chromosomal replication initiator protein DnaA [Christensenellaceae bacterium]
METFEILWNNALTELEKTVSPISFSTYVAKLKPVDIEDNRLILCTESELFANFIFTRLVEKINMSLKNLNAGVEGFELCVGNSREDYLKFKGCDRGEMPFPSMPIDAKHTFESFVVGSSNKMLYAAARAVAEAPGDSYNPLFIYGGSGLGKTHIMHAIANYIKDATPKTNVLYSTCENFTNELIESIRLRSTSRNREADFRKKYRNVDVLIVDDVQFLANKKTTQEEFFNTFNELYSQGKQIILSADCAPQNIETLSDRLVTRFSGGLTAQVLPPDLETKIAILQKKAAAKKCVISLEVATFLAENSGNDVRTLEGLLHKVIFASILHEKPITIDLARAALSETSDRQQEALTPSVVISAVCDYYHVSEKDLIGKKKNREIAEPRQICVYLMTELLPLPLVSVGQAIGGRDHTTIMHARDKVAKLVSEGGRYYTEVIDLKNLILKK